jgi:hypothetical protein
MPVMALAAICPPLNSSNTRDNDDDDEIGCCVSLDSVVELQWCFSFLLLDVYIVTAPVTWRWAQKPTSGTMETPEIKRVAVCCLCGACSCEFADSERDSVIVCRRLLTWFLLPSAVSLQLIVPMV